MAAHGKPTDDQSFLRTIRQKRILEIAGGWSDTSFEVIVESVPGVSWSSGSSDSATIRPRKASRKNSSQSRTETTMPPILVGAESRRCPKIVTSKALG